MVMVFHDTWKPLGVDARYRSTMVIHIYNRYGKLIKQVNPNGQGWNGTLNGKNLSVDDYWYVVTFQMEKNIVGILHSLGNSIILQHEIQIRIRF